MTITILYSKCIYNLSYKKLMHRSAFDNAVRLSMDLDVLKLSLSFIFLPFAHIIIEQLGQYENPKFKRICLILLFNCTIN